MTHEQWFPRAEARKTVRREHLDPTPDAGPEHISAELQRQFGLSGGEVNKRLIYVVDDEPMVLELATAILEPLGYRVECFRDPEATLQAFGAAQPQPDLIITDYAMHALTGMQLTEEVRRLRPGQKVLMVSGTVDENIFQDVPSKPDLFLAKPYQAKQLAAAVRALLQ